MDSSSYIFLQNTLNKPLVPGRLRKLQDTSISIHKTPLSSSSSPLSILPSHHDQKRADSSSKKKKPKIATRNFQCKKKESPIYSNPLINYDMKPLSNSHSNADIASDEGLVLIQLTTSIPNTLTSTLHENDAIFQSNNEGVIGSFLKYSSGKMELVFTNGMRYSVIESSPISHSEAVKIEDNTMYELDDVSKRYTCFYSV